MLNFSYISNMGRSLITHGSSKSLENTPQELHGQVIPQIERQNDKHNPTKSHGLDNYFSHPWVEEEHKTAYRNDIKPPMPVAKFSTFPVLKIRAPF